MSKIRLSADSMLTVLERLEKLGAAPEYQCRSGFCGACRMSLDTGDIQYIDAPLACIGDGEFLPCISVAKNELVINTDTPDEKVPVTLEKDV